MKRFIVFLFGLGLVLGATSVPAEADSTGQDKSDATYELYFDLSAFSYGESIYKPFSGSARKVRNVSELLRLLNS